MRTLNNSLARELTKNKNPDIEIADVIAVGKGTVDVKTSTGSIYRHVSIAGGASIGDKVRLQFIRNKPLAFGGSGSSNNSGGGGSVGSSITYTGGALSTHALNGPYHTGQLDSSQATWAFAVDGSRAMTGSIVLAAGLTVDGVDISVFGTRQVLSSGLGLSGGGILYSGDVTISLTSSSNPGAAASILASDTGGGLQLTGLGIGVSPITGQVKVQGTTNGLVFAYGTSTYWTLSATTTGDANFLPNTTNAELNLAAKLKMIATGNLLTLGYDSTHYWTFNSTSAGNLSLTPFIANSELTLPAKLKMIATSNLLTLGYDGTTNYWTFNVSSAGVLTATGNVSNADFIIIGDLGVGGAVPAGQTEQTRIAYDGNNYFSVNVSSTGVVTLSNTAATSTNGNIFLNPANRLGIGMSTTPNAKVEIRENITQLRLAYDGTNYSDFQTGSGGNLTVTTYGSDMVLDLQPVGGIAGTKTLRPANGYDANLGSLTKKWLAIHAAELWVENLVAYDTTAIMGGRWNISNASILTADWPSVSSGPATIAFRSADSASIPTGITSWVVNKPAGALQDDIVIYIISAQDAATITLPSGFSTISGPTDWQGTRRVLFCYKVLGASEPSTYTFTMSIATAGTWGAVAFSGVDTATPINVTGTFTFNSTGSTSMTASAVSPSVTNTMLVMLGVTNSNGSMTPAGGMTERVDIVNASAFNISFIASEALTSTGTTGSRVATISTSSQSVAGLIALKPGTVGGSGNTITLKHNSFSVGDIGRLEANGRVEWVQVTAGPTGTGPYTYTFTRNLDGTGSNDWVAGDAIVNTGQAGTGWLDVYSMWSSKGTPIEYIYNFKSSAFSANLSQSTAFNLFGSSIASGDIIYYGMGGGMWNGINHYITSITGSGFTGVLEYWNGSAWTTVSGYTTTIYLASTGAATSLTAGALPASGQTGTYVHSFSASQSGWAKTTINSVNAYWIRHRCTANTSAVAANGYKRTVRGSAQYGPTMVGWVRNSTTFNDFQERFALGNLHGLYDYGKVTYGWATGKYSSVWLATDDTNGFRVMGNTVVLGQWDTTGKITVGVNANSKARVEITPTGKVSIWQVDSGGGQTERFYVNVNGDMRIVGDASNYVDINGSTGVATFSGVINVVGGSMSGVTYSSGTITGGAISGGTITGSDFTGTILNGNVNQLYNSSFETDSNGDGVPDGWAIYNNNTGSSATASIQTSGGVDNGKYYRLTLTATNNGTKGILAATSTNRTGVKQNTDYVISWYAKAGGPGSGGSIGRTMALAWNFTPGTIVTISNPVLTTSWQRYAFKVNWGGGTLDPNIFITVATGSYASGSIIEIDHVQLEQNAYLSPYKPSLTDMVDVVGKITLPVAPSGSGLFLTSTYMGYYSGATWQTYMDSSGNLMLRGANTANIGVLSFDPSTARLSGGYYAGAGYTSYVEQWYTDGVTGAISAGAGTVVLGLDGIDVTDGTGITLGGNSVTYGKLSTFSYYGSNLTGQVSTRLERATLGPILIGPATTSYYSDASGWATIYFGGTVSATASGFVTVSANTRYKITGQYKNTGAIVNQSYVFFITVNYYNSSNTLLSSTDIGIASEANQTFANWTSYDVSFTTPANTAKVTLLYWISSFGTSGTVSGSVTIAGRRTRLRSETYYSSVNAINIGVMIGDHLLFSDSWQGFPDNVSFTYRSEISNDTGTYKALMIVGNKSAAGNRRVRIYDRLTVNSELNVTGTILDQDQLVAWTTLTTYAANWADFGSTYKGVKYKKFGDLVFLTGMAGRSTSTSTSGANIITGIPAAIRPATNNDVICNLMTSIGAVRADINSAGNIVLYGAIPSGGWVSFTGVFYSVA